MYKENFKNNNLIALLSVIIFCCFIAGCTSNTYTNEPLAPTVYKKPPPVDDSQEALTQAKVTLLKAVMVMYSEKRYDEVVTTVNNIMQKYKEDDSFTVLISYYAGLSLTHLNRGFESDYLAMSYFRYCINHVKKVNFPASINITKTSFTTELYDHIGWLLTQYIRTTEFQTGSYINITAGFDNLDKAVKLMKFIPWGTIYVEGHTDSVGDYNYNLRLSQKRADAVKNYLINRGIQRERIVSVGYGETKPIASNATRKGRQANRRVNILVIP